MTSPNAPPIPTLELVRGSTRPLHQQLLMHYRNLIEAGHFPVGSRLPTEMAIMEEHQVSRGTVRQAMRSLNEAGLIHRETKNGTVVTRPPKSSAVRASRIIGVVFPETHDAFCLDIMKGVQVACRERDYHVAFGYSQHSSVLERVEIMRMRHDGFSGVLVLPHPDTTLFSELQADNYPFVCIDQCLAGVLSDFVGVDNIGASFSATEHLIQLGHRHIIFAHQGAEIALAPSTVQDRYRGYRDALAAYEIPFEDSWVLSAENASSYVEFSKHAGHPSAAVAANDHTAFRLMDVAQKLGVAVPEAFAVVGFDDVPMAAEVCLTTVVQPSVEIGIRAARILIDRIEGSRTPIQQLLLPTRLAIRKSCGAGLIVRGKDRGRIVSPNV